MANHIKVSKRKFFNFINSLATLLCYFLVDSLSLPLSFSLPPSPSSLSLYFSLSLDRSLSLALSPPSLLPLPLSLLLSLSDVYHLVFNPPKSADIADRLTEEPGGIEKNMHSKLSNYHRHADSVLSCYRGIARKFNADQPIQDLFTQSECAAIIVSFSLDKLPHNITQYSLLWHATNVINCDQ